jgi:regulatory protein
VNDPANPAGVVIAAIRFEQSALIPRAAVHFADHPKLYVLRRDAVRLEVGQRLDHDTLANLQQRYQTRAAYLQAVRFLGARDRSAQEIENHLIGKGWDAAACAGALAKLRAEGYVDDSRLAQMWVAHRCRSSQRSRMAVTQELRQKGIDQGTITAAVAVMDEDALALACARKKRRQWRRYTEEERQRRMVMFLRRKGFPYDACRKAAQKLREEPPDD